MKKLVFLLSFLVVGMIAIAQTTTTRTLGLVDQGNAKTYNSTLADTLKSQNTLNFVFKVNHVNDVNIAIAQTQTVVANDTTVAMTLYESMDGIKWFKIQYSNSGTQTDLPTYTLAKGTANVSYFPEMKEATLRMRYLKIAYVALNKTGFKKLISGEVKFNIK